MPALTARIFQRTSIVLQAGAMALGGRLRGVHLVTGRQMAYLLRRLVAPAVVDNSLTSCSQRQWQRKERRAAQVKSGARRTGIACLNLGQTLQAVRWSKVTA